MSKIKLKHSSGNSVSIAAPVTNPAADRTLYVPSNANGTLITNTTPGTILQVVSRFQNTQKSTTTSGSFVDVTDVYAAITPASTSNKILVLINGMVSNTANIGCGFRLKRTIGGSSTEIGGANNTATQSGILNLYVNDHNNMFPFNYNFLDSPSTTSAATYQLTWRNSGGTTYWNTYSGSVGEDYDGASSVVLMEVAG